MNSLVNFSIQNRLLAFVLGLVVVAAGYWSYRALPVDAFPDVSPSLVQVFTETEGLAPEEVEKYVTYPVEVAMNGLPGVERIRSVSNFGLSVVNVYFEDGTDVYFARQLVGERLQEAREQIPAIFGERLVIRILDRASVMPGLGEIFLLKEDLETVQGLCREPNGIIIANGPTGSGKTTLLYSMLMETNRAECCVMTAEDPVEYTLEGVAQIQIKPALGFTFGRALRSMLRQDPDVIMVGEIRDEETARIAMRAALTGHLVLSTLHTNDAPAAFCRLRDIGIEPYLIVATVRLVIARCSVDSDAVASLDPRRCIDGADHRGKAHLAGHDRRMAGVAAVIGHDRSDQVQHGVERFAGGGADNYFAVFEVE